MEGAQDVHWLIARSRPLDPGDQYGSAAPGPRVGAPFYQFCRWHQQEWYVSSLRLNYQFCADIKAGYTLIAAELRSHFGSYGSVSSIRFMHDRFTGNCWNYWYAFQLFSSCGAPAKLKLYWY